MDEYDRRGLAAMNGILDVATRVVKRGEPHLCSAILGMFALPDALSFETDDDSAMWFNARTDECHRERARMLLAFFRMLEREGRTVGFGFADREGWTGRNVVYRVFRIGGRLQLVRQIDETESPSTPSIQDGVS